MSDTPPDPGGKLPARRVSSGELEAIIRRAVELQSSGEPGDEGLTEAEVVRIGQEVGLAPEVVRRAMLDVRAAPAEERGVLAGVMGPGRVRAVRTVRAPAPRVAALLEEYLLRCEYMVVQRRFPDRTRYVRDRGFAAGFGRLARQLGRREARLELKELDVAVSALDEETALVELSVELTGERAGFAVGGTAAGIATGTPAAVFALFTAAPDLLALAALPIFGGWVLGMRAGYRYSARQAQEKLESFLDRLEHGELRLPRPGEWAETLKRLRPPRR